MCVGIVCWSLLVAVQVMFVEQQVVKNRVKRDHSYKYSPPSDAKWKDQWYLVSVCGWADGCVVDSGKLQCCSILNIVV